MPKIDVSVSWRLNAESSSVELKVIPNPTSGTENTGKFQSPSGICIASEVTPSR